MLDGDHQLALERSVGSSSSFYTATCSCGWVGGDQPRADVAEGEWRDHLAGRRQPWQMAPGERREWRAGRTRAADLPGGEGEKEAPPPDRDGEAS